MTNETSNQTKKFETAKPKFVISSGAKLIYLEGESFSPTGIKLWREENGEREEVTASTLVSQGNVYPTTKLTGEVTDIRFTWGDYDNYLPIVVKKAYSKGATPVKKEVPLTKSTTATWFPATGEMATTFTDVVLDKTPLKFALKHVHINNDGLYSCGRSWKLNLHKKVTSATKSVLASIENNTMDECDYVYTDEYGTMYKFEEQYYAIDKTGSKIYCNKADVFVNQEGILMANVDFVPHTAYREFVSVGGLTLWGKYQGVAGAKILEEKNENVEAAKSKIKHLENSIATLDVQISDIADKISKETNNEEKALLESEKSVLESEMETLEANLTQCQIQLQSLTLQLPTVYINDAQGVTMCFNENGNLCAIVDSYGNAVSIVWEKKYLEDAWVETITKIYEGDFCTNLVYNSNGLIQAIVSPDGKESTYTYENAEQSKLNTVTYPDGTVLQFIYDDTCGNGKYVTQVTQSNGQKGTISYNHYKPQVITTYSCAGNVTNDSALNTTYQKVDEVTLCSKTLTDMPYVEQDGLKQTIFVDEFCAEVGGFAQRDSNVYQNPLTYSHYDKQNKWGYTVTEEKYQPMTFGSCDVTGTRLVATIPVSTLKPRCNNFVFSATSTSKQDIAESYSPLFNLPFVQIGNDRQGNYRLFAELLDETGTVEQSYQASINFQNRIVKATALPITLLSTTQTVKLYAQHDGEEGAYFKNLRFAPCSWESFSYDDFGNVTQSTTSQKCIGFDAEGQAQYVHTQTTNTYNSQGKLAKTEQATMLGEATLQTTVSKYQYCNHGNVVREETYVEGKQATDGVAVIERVCDEKGNVIKQISYNSLDSSTKFYSETIMDETGKVLYEVDETGENKTELIYKDGTTQVKAQALPNGSTFAYGTDESGNVTSITHSTSLGEGNSTNTNYTHGLPTKVTSGNNVVDYTYDYKDRVTKVVVNGEETTYQYQEDAVFNNKKCDVTTVNSRGVTATAYVDNEGQTLRTVVDDVVVDSAYDQTGKLLSKGNLSYTYDELDRLTCVQQDNVATETYTYDEFGRMSSKTVDGNTYSYAYKDNISSKLQSLTLPNGAVMQPLVDVNGRNKGKELLVDGNKVVAEHISYRKVGDHATNQPVAIYFGDKSNGEFAIKGNLKYKYDGMGNVTHVFQDGMLVCTYTYDKLSRLIREDNKKLGKTYLYSYDNCGNMLSRRIANYTTKPAEEIEFSEETLYSHIGDRLVSVNGQSLSYDNYGRLLNYNGSDLHWEGNRLVGFDGMDIVYDSFGRRIQKYDTTFTYDSSNNLLTAGALSFFYDTHGIAGFTYEGETYYYRKNIQGDVIALLTADGTVVATYLYDAWGNCIIATDTNGIGELNPIRYRGYYWDAEFGLYYLQSRYYSPTLCRFISQDSIEYLDPESINGLNLYAYCGNNPIMNIDPDGHAWYNVLGWIGLGLVVAAATVLTCGAFGVAVGGAGLLGAVIHGAAVGALIGAGAGAALGAVGGMVYDAYQGNDFGTSIWEGIQAGFGIGAIAGAVIGGAYSYFSFGNFASTTQLDAHFAKHGNEFNGLYSNATEYAKGAKYTIRHGQKVTYMYNGNTTTGYIRFFGSGGKANYAFVGLNGSKTATFGIRSVSSLVKELGFTIFGL